MVEKPHICHCMGMDKIKTESFSSLSKQTFRIGILFFPHLILCLPFLMVFIVSTARYFSLDRTEDCVLEIVVNIVNVHTHTNTPHTLCASTDWLQNRCNRFGNPNVEQYFSH